MDIHYNSEHLHHIFRDKVRFERCGFLIGARVNGRTFIDHVVEVHNLANDPTNDFEVRRSQISELWGDRVIGIIHTHWTGSAEPSNNDFDNISKEYIGAVYHVPTGTVTFYDHNGYLEERP